MVILPAFWMLVLPVLPYRVITLLAMFVASLNPLVLILLLLILLTELLQHQLLLVH